MTHKHWYVMLLHSTPDTSSGETTYLHNLPIPQTQNSFPFKQINLITNKLTSLVPEDRRVALTLEVFLELAGVANGRVVESWGGLKGIKGNLVSPNMHCLELEFLLVKLSFLLFPESALPNSVLSLFLILLKQSFRVSWVAGWLNQHKKSSSTFIFTAGCRTFPGDILYQFPCSVGSNSKQRFDNHTNIPLNFQCFTGII